MAKRGRKPKERTGYFYEKEEQAIIDYIKCTDPYEKNQTFNSVILPALTKMIESIIRRYKLFVPDEQFPQTFNDTISYLLTKINNFKPEIYVYDEFSGYTTEPPVDITNTCFNELKKTINENSPKYVRVFEETSAGTIDIHELYNEVRPSKIFKLELHRYKAYSYCGTVCKNYLIYKNIQYTKSKQRNLPYDEMIEDFSRDPKYMTSGEDGGRTGVEQLISDVSEKIKDMINERDKNMLTDDEVRVGVALTELLDNWEDVLKVDGSNKLLKSSVLYFLREETMMTTKVLRDNMRAFKKAYFLLKKALL